MLHTEHFAIPHHGDRRVRVYVPKAYDGSSAFPLLVMFDGQNVFDDAGSFAGGMFVHQSVEKLGKKRTRPIVVGIDHAGAGRIDELAPWGRRGGHGRADTFVGWIADRLVPQLRARYHVVPGPAGVLLAGSSLGGLAATYGHFNWPETFGGALAMSPSYWLGAPRIFDFVAAQSKPWTSQIYVDTGAQEGGGGGARLAERMVGLLRERGYANDRVRLRIDRKGGHNERTWRRRMPAALRFFYA